MVARDVTTAVVSSRRISEVHESHREIPSPTHAQLAAFSTGLTNPSLACAHAPACSPHYYRTRQAHVGEVEVQV